MRQYSMNELPFQASCCEYLAVQLQECVSILSSIYFPQVFLELQNYFGQQYILLAPAKPCDLLYHSRSAVLKTALQNRKVPCNGVTLLTSELLIRQLECRCWHSNRRSDNFLYLFAILLQLQAL